MLKDIFFAMLLFGFMYFFAMRILDWFERLLDRWFEWFENFMVEVDDELEEAGKALYEHPRDVDE